MPQYDFHDGISLKTMRVLKTRDAYKRLIIEREVLDMMIKKSLDKTGQLNSPEVLMQDKVVEKLGEEVLLEIHSIELSFLFTDH